MSSGGCRPTSSYRTGPCCSVIRAHLRGGVISPLLVNIFLHLGFDQWMRKHDGPVGFEWYADDIVVHCRFTRIKRGRCPAKTPVEPASGVARVSTFWGIRSGEGHRGTIGVNCSSASARR